MTRLSNDPARFAEQALDGFAAAHPGLVRRVSGGVVRAAAPAPGRVAVVVGGGSGHYPAFAGLVGDGLAHGAAVGNVFASPSARQVRSVARAASGGGGILLAYGNYAGDVLNFTAARVHLEAEGVDCRAVAVTDDLASAPAEQADRRRGIAGGLVVFKVAAAAADRGLDLDEVERIARLANARTRSFGVALTGCTLPGAAAPLFAVPGGRMAVGLGIHGEPGIDERDRPSADGLAELLVDTVLAELPAGIDAPAGQRAAVLLNGLGSVKYEELFVVYRRVAELLAAAGVQVVAPAVGELVTSFEMAGVSLTVCWLTDELVPLWCAPADAPGFRRGLSATAAAPPAPVLAEEAEEPVPPASPASRAAGRRLLGALVAARDAVDAHADELGRIDALAGDGDHGIGMSRGVNAAVSAAVAAVAAGAGVGTALTRAGDAWADAGGGTSGALWGVALRGAAVALGDDREPTAARVTGAVSRALADVTRVGGAAVGDKTLVDAFAPFAATLADRVQAGQPVAAAWREAAAVADVAARATADLVPRVGRARPLAHRSVGAPDAGAVSLALILAAVADAATAPTREEETAR
ncbi:MULTISPECIES: dihydroxyacetone kinase family protein [Micromonospora]|uniref:Dihydroxyacetone kinase n=1 Tax=Micromonospora haikouensis TaxID=686309 RepID=A0A0D0WR06_9ACTN|nr:dihydroxyacetone kinase family protein [Micromonospora haikouensis]KIR61431.1 dihydroxyacetone kinase [Micromonospora haikouensis]